MTRGFTRREKALLLCLAVLLVAAVYYLFIDQPTRASLADADNRLADAETSLTIEQAKAGELERMRRELEDAAGTAGGAVTPDYDNARGVVSALNAALSKAQSYQLSFRPVEFGDQLARRDIEMAFVCRDYATAAEIVRTLYAGPYRCEIVALNLAPAPGRQGGGLADGEVRASLTVRYLELYRQAD